MAHAWRFFRAGGVDQVQLTRGADLANLGELDQKLWVALACPVEGLEIDARTLHLIDSDGDNRVRSPELVAAARWATSLLKNADSLTKGTALALDNLEPKQAEAQEILTTAKALLAATGKADAKEIGVGDIAGAIEAFAKQPFNGDGVVPPAAARDDATRAALADIIAASDAPADRGGEKGVSEASLAAFLGELAAYVAWLDAGTGEAVLPLGDQTAAAFAALEAVRDKVSDYFTRAKVAAFDARALGAMNRAESEYAVLGDKTLSASADELVNWPLSHVEAGKPLPLTGFVNPAWAGRLEALQKTVLTPLLGPRSSLTADDWALVQQRLAGHAAYQAQKPSTRAASLAPERARALGEAELVARIRALIAEDDAQKPTFLALGKVEKLVYLHRDLFELANNFVSFRAFYARSGKAAFQYGTLFIDQRECELVVRVTDAGRHAALSPLSKCYLLYCDIKNAKGQKGQIVAALTAGEGDNLMVGRNGIFYDRAGGDWDAVVTKIVENPISVRGAFWAPYKKVLRTIEEYVSKRAAAAEAESGNKLDSGLAAAQSAADGQPKPVAPPAKLDIGVVAALGVAVGGITAALGALLQAFFGLGMFMPIGVLGLLLVISGPSMAVTWLKLRQRNLGPLLDANGWAVNTQAKVNVAFGESLTRLPKLPDGASRDLTDPFAEKKKPWGFYVFMLVLLGLAVAWYIGKLDSFLPAPARSVSVLGEAAPAHVKLAEPPPAAK
jgi:hypothetical protein